MIGTVVSRIAVVLVCVILLFIVVVPTTISMTTSLIEGDEFAPSGLLVILVLAGVIVALIAVFRTGSSWKKIMRLSEFANANSLSYAPATSDARYPGMIFTIGHDCIALDRIYSFVPRYREIANYRYVTGNGKSRSTHNWGFVAIQLDRKLPHMVLDARSNNFLGTNLPATFSRNQVLHLEGDFDKYFTLYCPKEYERDALYVFTPDLMALLIDESARYDVEIVDDWLLLYSSSPWNMLDPHTFDMLFTIMETVGKKTVTQTDYYSDDRVGNRALDAIAPQGRRLHRGASITGFIVFGVFIAWWLFATFSNFS